MQKHLQFSQARSCDLAGIRTIALSYPEEFATYYDRFPMMVRNRQVFVIKKNDVVLAFATYGINKDDPKECFTSSARSASITRKELSADWLRSQFELVLLQRGFKKFTAHVRVVNKNAIKMLLRHGYRQVANTATLDKSHWLQFCKIS